MMRLPKSTSVYRSIQDISKIGKNLTSSMVRIHSDQCQCFESKLIKDPCSIADVEKSRTTPTLHPIGNGQVERFNKTFLVRNIGRVEEELLESTRPNSFACLQFHIHDSVGFSPFLRFGIIPVSQSTPLMDCPDVLAAKTHVY